MEALLSDDAIADEAKKFDSSVKMLTLREYDYLDFRLIQNYTFIITKLLHNLTIIFVFIVIVIVIMFLVFLHCFVQNL